MAANMKWSSDTSKTFFYLVDISQNNYLTQTHIHSKYFKMWIYLCNGNNVTQPCKFCKNPEIWKIS